MSIAFTLLIFVFSSSGARIALVDWNASTTDLQRSFNQLSGVLLTGGHCGINGTPYGKATKAFLDMVSEGNDNNIKEKKVCGCAALFGCYPCRVFRS